MLNNNFKDFEMTNKKDRLADYKHSYSYNALIKAHSLSEYGIWEVFGEDSNCDMGGFHHMPSLGLYEGKLQDVLEIAVELPNFWNWGGGGDIRKTKTIKPIKVDAETNAKRDAIKHKIANLESQLKMAKEELEAL